MKRQHSDDVTHVTPYITPFVCVEINSPLTPPQSVACLITAGAYIVTILGACHQ
jgi:hypothetical protein